MGYFRDDDNTADAAGISGACKTMTGKRPMRTKAGSKRRRASTAKDRATADRLLGKLKDVPSSRPDLVSRVRKAIADGSYDTPDRLDAAVSAMLRELLEDEGDSPTK
jgi:hypothetical protein